MKISQIIQETTTTAGSVAPTEMGFVKMQTRNPSVYGGNKVGNLLKGKKTSKPFANSLNEAAMKDLAYDLQTMKPAEFQKKYGKTREEMKASMSKQPQQRPAPPVNETDLSEQDLIVVPGQGRNVKTGFVPHDKDRTDHEVEMAVSDLFSAGKNAEKIYNIVRSVSEDEGLEGWVQEKIIKANDYLNTVREYLEGKQLRSVAEQTMYEGVPADNDMGTVAGTNNKMTLGQWKQMWQKKMPKADMSLFRFPPNMQGSAIAYFDGWVNTPGAKWDPQKGVTENNQRGDSLVTDSLKIMRGPELDDALRALKTVLGVREYNSRRGFYNFYVKQIIDMYGKQGATESLGTTGAMTNGEMGESQLDELSPQALGSYVKSAAGDMANRKGDTQFQKGARVATSAFNSKLPASRFEKDAKIEKRQAGIDRAVDKITSKK